MSTDQTFTIQPRPKNRRAETEALIALRQRSISSGYPATAAVPPHPERRVPIPSAMPALTLDPWSAEQSAATLRQLRKDYPGYTTNELYAIWCHVNGRISLDSSGRAQIEAWKRQAERDGRHVEGGFRVSTSLFGRARYAKRGVPKPPRKTSAKTWARRKEPEISAAAVTGISGQALALARSYDRTAKALEAILAKQSEIDALHAEVRQAKPGVLAELAASHPEAAAILEAAGPAVS